MSKKILIFTNHFYPENFKVNDIAFDLVEKGADVTVITGMPNYPLGKVFEGYGVFKRSREIVKGVQVIRLPLITRGKNSMFRLALNYISYLISTTIYSLFYSVNNTPDSIFIHETSPIFIAIPAILVSKIKKIPISMWVLDLWPESMTIGFKNKGKYVERILNELVKWIYKNVNVIYVPSSGFKKSIHKKCDNLEIRYLPNWSESIFEDKVMKGTKLQLNKDLFNIVYAGTIGLAQDIESILYACKETKAHKEIKWTFIGDGNMCEYAHKYIKENNLSVTVEFVGRYPLDEMPTIYNQADLMLLTLKPSPIYSLTIPARMQSYMASKKPILGMIDGEASNIILNAKCGLCVKSGDYVNLAKEAIRLYNNRSELNVMALNSLMYYNDNFKKERVLGDFCNELINNLDEN